MTFSKKNNLDIFLWPFWGGFVCNKKKEYICTYMYKKPVPSCCWPPTKGNQKATNWITRKKSFDEQNPGLPGVSDSLSFESFVHINQLWDMFHDRRLFLLIFDYEDNSFLF